MILSLCTLAMVGTAAAQNRLFSFARNKMMENHEVSLDFWDDSLMGLTDHIPTSNLATLASVNLVTARSKGAVISASSETKWYYPKR
jgi:hypothetical protein